MAPAGTSGARVSMGPRLLKSSTLQGGGALGFGSCSAKICRRELKPFASINIGV